MFISAHDYEITQEVEIRRLTFNFYFEDWLIVVYLEGPNTGSDGATGFWRTNITRRIEVPVKNFRVLPIQPLRGGEIECNPDMEQLIGWINDAESYNLTLYRKWESRDASKRFAGVGPLNFLDLKATRDTVQISFDKINFEKFLEKYPPNRSQDAIAIDISRKNDYS